MDAITVSLEALNGALVEKFSRLEQVDVDTQNALMRLEARVVALETAPAPIPVPIPVPPTGKVIDGGLTPAQVTADYGIRIIIDTQAKLDALMAESGGILTVKNGGGPWFKNLANVSLKKLVCPNTWTVLFENVGLVEIEEIEAVDGKTGVELKGKTHLEAGKVVSRGNFRKDGTNDQGEGLICNSELSTFHIKHLITSDNGDSGIDNKGVGIVDLWESDKDNGGLKNHNKLTVHAFKVTNCGRGKRTSFGFGIQSRSDGGQDALTTLGSGVIENVLHPDQSVKASVVNTGRKAIVDVKSNIVVKRPQGYTGQVTSKVNGGTILNESNIVAQ